MRQLLSSWKTTGGALLVTLGYGADKYQRHWVCPDWVGTAASVAFIVGIILIGIFARDNDKSSEDVGAHRK
jgi:hypothetical protein